MRPYPSLFGKICSCYIMLFGERPLTTFMLVQEAEKIFENRVHIVFPFFRSMGAFVPWGRHNWLFPPKKTFSFFDPCQPCSTNKETDENQKTKTCLVFNSLLFVDCLKPACVTVVSTTVLLCSSEICASSPFLACITTSWCLPR